MPDPSLAIVSSMSRRGVSGPMATMLATKVQKKKNEARKKQKIIEVKEIKMRPNIDTLD